MSYCYAHHYHRHGSLLEEKEEGEVCETKTEWVAICYIYIFTLIFYHSKSSDNVTSDTAASVPGGGGGDGEVYEDPDKLASTGQGNYELTQCPAYESTTSKLQPRPTEVQSSHYEM